MIATDRFTQVDVLGVPVHAGTMEDAVDVVGSWVEDRDPGYAIFRDVHGIMQSQRHDEVLAAHQDAGLVACDGIPLVWAAKWAGVPEVERVCGPDFLMAFCAQAEAQGWKSFFYGGKEGVPEKVAAKLREQFPDLQVAGTHSPPFRPLTPAEKADEIELINRSEADIVWVGLSTPKQELWMQDHVGHVDAPALLGVGAAFDFLTGDIRRAPRWLQGTGFEWVHRVLSEPKRLGARYLRNNPAFMKAILFNRPRLHIGTATRTARPTEGNTSHG